MTNFCQQVLKSQVLLCGILLYLTGMPTPGDLKSGDSLFYSPPDKLTQPPMGMTQDIIYEVLHEVHTIKIRNHHFVARDKSIFVARDNLCERLNTCKNALETVLQKRKIQVLRGKWAKSQTQEQKA